MLVTTCRSGLALPKRHPYFSPQSSEAVYIRGNSPNENSSPISWLNFANDEHLAVGQLNNLLHLAGGQPVGHRPMTMGGPS